MTHQTKPTVVLADSIAVNPLRWIQSRVRLIEETSGDRSRLLDELPLAQGLIVRTYTIVDRQLLDHAPNLRVVARAGVGLDNIDLDECAKRGIQVVHTPYANTNAVVEYVVGRMLDALRPITPVDSTDLPISDALWHTMRSEAVTPRSCVGARLGIIGFGQIGSALARVASPLGMEVVYTDIREIPESDRAGAVPIPLCELASTCDVVSIHVDGRSSNRNMLSADFFNQLQHNTILINSARGMVIDDLPAAQYAKSNPEASLILDVHDPEPIAPDSPLSNLANVVRTLHIASGTASAKEQMSWVVRDVHRVLSGEAPEFPAE